MIAAQMAMPGVTCLMFSAMRFGRGMPARPVAKAVSSLVPHMGGWWKLPTRIALSLGEVEGTTRSPSFGVVVLPS